MAGEEESVTVIRMAGRDAFGDPTSTATESVLEGCLFAPGPSRELGVAAAGVDTDATVYAQAGADVRASDRIRARGQIYTVVGDPQDWGSSGVVIVLRKAA